MAWLYIPMQLTEDERKCADTSKQNLDMSYSKVASIVDDAAKIQCGTEACTLSVFS